jgi:hypothetical protein
MEAALRREMDPREVWSRALVPPGPNGGRTVGEDLILGSSSNSQPLAAPERLSVRRVTTAAVGDEYEVRAVRVVAVGPLARWD